MPLRGNDPGSTSSNYNQSRSAAKPRAPRRNRKVPFQKPARKARKKIVDNKQSKMINKLSKQVYQLQMQSYGSVQQNLHTLDRTLVPTAATPCCLDLTDFTCERVVNGVAVSHGARVFQARTLAPQWGAVSKWKKSSYIQDNYYWKEQNQDQPDTGKYLAMNCTYFVEVFGNPNLDNTRIRFDLIAQKPEAIHPQAVVGASTPQTPRVLPFSLTHLQQLAVPHINRINPVYFKKYFTKTIFINSSKTNANTKGTTANIQRFSFKLNPNKIMSQVETNPQVGDVPIVDETTGVVGLQAEIPHGNFGPLNVSPLQPLWLLISTDDQVSSVGDQVNIKMSRRVVWRDAVGGSNL